MTSISLENPIEVILAICFVVIAVVALLATFGVTFAYLFSNFFERWPEYETRRKLQIVRNLAVSALVIFALLWFASNRL